SRGAKACGSACPAGGAGAVSSEYLIRINGTHSHGRAPPIPFMAVRARPGREEGDTMRADERMSTPTQRCKQVLRGLPLFRAAREADLDALAGLTRLDALERRGILFKRGDPCDGFHVLAYGRIKLSLVTEQGIEKPLQVVEPGESLGDITMF